MPSLESVPFFSDEITIKVHTATDPQWIGRRVQISRFCDTCPGRPVRLQRILDGPNAGELVLSRGTGADLDFIEGAEA